MKACHRICIAPMLNWTNRHCRYFHRLLTRHAWLYTEMVTTGALLYGEAARYLNYNEAEHPVGLQLGGSDPKELARCAKLGEDWHYDEINLNCGCPSERVERGAFGACLMMQRERVSACVRAMRDAVSIPITVKHRIGIDHIDDYAFVRDFVGTVANADCHTFIVHARNAILKGLSPKENRNIPPLKHHYVYQLKRDFPHLEIIINGGIKTLDQMTQHLSHVDGVMLGREAYHHPWLLTAIDPRFYNRLPPVTCRSQIVGALVDYARFELARGTPLNAITRHALGLYQHMPGARCWRRILSDHRKLAANDLQLLEEAMGQCHACLS